MDNNLLNILLGVIGNVMTSLLACMTTKTGQALIEKISLNNGSLRKRHC